MMNTQELRASAGLAGVYSLRMLGMFLILPVFALYASKMPGGENHTLIGLAMGAYGLTQALFQLPLGMLSDRIGRKKVIYGGLTVFALGSLLAGYATSVETMILGRALQGAGAVSAAVTALLADLTREEYRTRAMAMIGTSIGLSFAISLVLGPILAEWAGLSGLFFITGLLTVLAIGVVHFIVPNPAISRFHSDAETHPARLSHVLKHPELLRLNIGIFALHAAQMALFTALPFMLIQQGMTLSTHWKIYLPLVIVGFVLMVPAIIYGEKRHQLKPVFLMAIVLMVIAQTGLGYSPSLGTIIGFLGLYFVAFNILEATLPSLVSKIAPASAKGSAMGVYNTAQSLGLFLGGSVGGALAHYYSLNAVFVFCMVIMLIWLIIAFGMKAPPAVSSKMLSLSADWKGNAIALTQAIQALPGVHEVVVLPEEHVIYLKVAQGGWDETPCLQLIEKERKNGLCE